MLVKVSRLPLHLSRFSTFPANSRRFAPSRALTGDRKQKTHYLSQPVTAFLHRALGGIVEPVSDPIDFTDDDGSAFEGDIAWLSATGITRGCSETEFYADEVVTRGQMAAFLGSGSGLHRRRRWRPVHGRQRFDLRGRHRQAGKCRGDPWL